MLQGGDTEKYPQAFGFESLDPFFTVSKQGPCFSDVEEDGGDERLVQLKTCRGPIAEYSVFTIVNVSVVFCFAESMNLILIGGPSENKLSNIFLSKTPVEVKGKIANSFCFRVKHSLLKYKLKIDLLFITCII